MKAVFDSVTNHSKKKFKYEDNADIKLFFYFSAGEKKVERALQTFIIISFSIIVPFNVRLIFFSTSTSIAPPVAVNTLKTGRREVPGSIPGCVHQRCLQ